MEPNDTATVPKLSVMPGHGGGVLQPIWEPLYQYHHIVYHPLFMPAAVNVMYAFLITVFTAADALAEKYEWIGQHRVNPHTKLTWQLVRLSLGQFAWNNLVYVLPLSLAGAVFAPNPTPDRDAPPLSQFLYQICVAFLINDTLMFLQHVPLHKVRFLYKRIHAVHHAFHSPIAIYGHYLHPLEMIFLGLYITLSIKIFNPHLLTELGYQWVVLLANAEAHSGWRIPFLFAWIPFYGGAPLHDMHHRKPLTNFQSFFTWWDRLFGFACPGYGKRGVKPAELLAWEQKSKEAKDIAQQLDISQGVLDSDIKKMKSKRL